MLARSQLSLNVKLVDGSTFASFYTGNNAEVIAYLQRLLLVRDEPLTYLWGSSGVGRSHLLQACCQQLSQQNIAAIYLPLDNYRQYTPEIFADLEEVSLLCLDDIDALCGLQEWEEALFYSFNCWRAAGVNLLVSAKSPPAKQGFVLPDLASRLAWGAVFQVRGLSDEQKVKALLLRAGQRGLRLSEQAAHFLVLRINRDFSSLFAVLEDLDQASLAEQSRITIPFIKKYLGL